MPPAFSRPFGRCLRIATLVTTLVAALVAVAEPLPAAEIDFNRDIKPILSNQCFFCHGPDEAERQGGIDGLRLDTFDGATADMGGHVAIAPGDLDASTLLQRVTSDDDGDVMPPPGSGRKLTAEEVNLIKRWIAEGAKYAEHWSYVRPVRPEIPPVSDPSWPRGGIDHFIMNRLDREGLKPNSEADRYALIRRLSLDLTGLPPTLPEVDRFVADNDPAAYEKWVDELMGRKSYGEHWARLWLDLARYADSAGYADDPERTIWLYRDYVIDAINSNKPFDQFTIEQIAGDLLPDATDEQLIATAFHRNTLTNSEGGTDDEEFRNAAIVDRVNTTLAVWMGTTMACAQCHSHKYDPITQEEYFKVFAILNNTEDADRRDETPLHSVYTPDQQTTRTRLGEEIAQVKSKLTAVTPELLAARDAWIADFPHDLLWSPLTPTEVISQAGREVSITDSVVSVAAGADKDTYVLTLPVAASDGPLRAISLETLPDGSITGGAGHGGGNFVVTSIHATATAPEASSPRGRYVRVELPGQQKMLSLAEVEIFSDGKNIATGGEATQSSTGFDGPANLANDGNTDGRYNEARSTTHTEISDNPWWEIDLKDSHPIDRLVIWNRTDEGTVERLKDFRVLVLDQDRDPTWEGSVAEPPRPSVELATGGPRSITFTRGIADYNQANFPAESVLAKVAPGTTPTQGWAVGGAADQPHRLVLVAEPAVEFVDGSRLTVTIEQQSPHAGHTLGRFRLSATSDQRAPAWATTPTDVISAASLAADQRSEEQDRLLTEHYLGIAPELETDRKQAAELEKRLAGIMPVTVPVLRELPAEKRRTTRLQHRGNFMSLGDEVEPGTPEAFHPLGDGLAADRLGLAHWLVDEANPLTARVVANRYWERMFGTGIVATSEEFGSQGDLPSHPELLDWLATELIRMDWDTKAFVKMLVMSAAYRQSSHVDPNVYEIDPENRLIARGPRFRLTAESIRDQALAVAGLLSEKMHGEPVKPPQPAIGLSAAFGSGIDWKTSDGEDRYRRALYTTWRRSNPYPSMATFDAPNREVCTLRRGQSNTPLQALVTLNDPVYIEAAQALARRMVSESSDQPADRIAHGFRLCLGRHASDDEIKRLLELYEIAHQELTLRPDEAMKLATEPLGPLPDGADAAEMAAWTTVANVLLNLDETLMRR